MEFRSDIEEVLKAAGWHRDRKVDVREWLEGLERDGVAAVPVAVMILENFGGLVVKPPGNPPGEFTIDSDMRDVLGIRDAEEFLVSGRGSRLDAKRPVDEGAGSGFKDSS